MTANREFLALPEVAEAIGDWPGDDLPPILWTDSFAALWPILDFGPIFGGN